VLCEGGAIDNGRRFEEFDRFPTFVAFRRRVDERTTQNELFNHRNSRNRFQRARAYKIQRKHRRHGQRIAEICG